MTVKLYFDGGCRPNPGRMETAVVLRGVVHRDADAGHGDSHDAEWLAAIAALQTATDHGLSDVTLLGDSRAVIAQIGAAKVPERSRVHRARFDVLAAGFVRLRVRYVKRSHNLAGQSLDRRLREGS